MDPETVNYHYCDDLTTIPLPPGCKVLVTGASGYVARRLIPELVARGYFVRCMLRNSHIPFLLEHPNLEVVYADCLRKTELIPALKGVKVAYYLIHSMRLKKNKFSDTDRLAAKNFAEVAEECDLEKIIYLGGLGEANASLSPHLRSRMEVGDTLSKGRVRVIRLRAAIIIGAGSASYELLKSLILHNRWIPFLAEFNSKCQPIAIRDVIKYLVGAMETKIFIRGVFPIGGKDVFTYKEMILRFAKSLHKSVRFFDVSWAPLPVTTLCRIYAYWLHFFISVPVNIISLLLDSLKTNVVCWNHEIRRVVPFEPMGFEEAVERALQKEDTSQVHSHWADVPPDKMQDLMPLHEYESSDFVAEQHHIDIPASAEMVFRLVGRIGGDNGWYHGIFLWRLRGIIDRFLGGVGLQRGRRDPDHLRIGDSVDFWRVERLEKNKELLLRAEMISPGFSWLQFQLIPVEEKNTRLTLTAHFIPYPFWGKLYWNVLSKFHTYIFKGMLNYFYNEATKAKQTSEIQKAMTE